MRTKDGALQKDFDKAYAGDITDLTNPGHAREIKVGVCKTPPTVQLLGL